MPRSPVIETADMNSKGRKRSSAMDVAKPIFPIYSNSNNLLFEITSKRPRHFRDRVWTFSDCRTGSGDSVGAETASSPRYFISSI